MNITTGRRAEKQAKAHPEQPAVEDAEGRLTYRELEEASDRVAGYLAARGLKQITGGETFGKAETEEKDS